MAIIGRIRKRAGLAVVFVAVAILAFVFNDLLSGGQQAPKDIVVVNNEHIPINEFFFEVDNIETRTKQQNETTSLSQEESFTIKNQVFEGMIQKRLLQEQYDVLGLSVGAIEITDMFLGDFIHQAAKQNFTDPQTGQYNKQLISQYISRFNELPEDQQISWTQFEDYLHDARLSEKYEKLLQSSFYMPKKAVEYLLDVYDNVTEANYIKIPLTSIEDSEISLTDADYKSYYEKYKNLYKIDEEQREVEFVKFPVFPSQKDLQDLADSARTSFAQLANMELPFIPSFVSTISDSPYDSTFVKAATLNKFFPDSLLRNLTEGSLIYPMENNGRWVMGRVLRTEKRADSIRISQIVILNSSIGAEHITRTKAEATQLADSVYAMVKANPQQYDESMLEYSDDPEVRTNNGDSGWLLDEQVPAVLFDKIAERKVDDIFLFEMPSGIGYAIVKITGKTAPVAKVRMAVVSLDIHASDNTINEIRDKAHRFLGEVKTITQMSEVAQRENVNKLSSTLREIDFKLNGTSYSRDIVRWAFNKDTKPGEVDGQVYELEDMFIVAGLKEIRKKGYLPLDQIKSTIEREVRNEKKTKMLLAKAQEASKGKTSLEAIAKELSLPIERAENNSFADPYFHREGPEMRLIGTLSTVKEKGILEPIKGFNGIYIVQVDDMHPNEQKEDPGMIRYRFDMTSQQKTMQMNFPMHIMKTNASIKSHFNFFQ